MSRNTGMGAAFIAIGCAFLAIGASTGNLERRGFTGQ
jgi:hypothetical protein